MPPKTLSPHLMLRTLIFVLGLSLLPSSQASIGGVALPREDASVLYLMSADGGVAAHQIADGQRLWLSATGQRPLALTDDLLIAQHFDADQPNTLVLVALDALTGVEQFRVSEALPQPANALIDDALGERFRIEQLDEPGLRFAWQWRYRLIQGALLVDGPGPEEQIITGIVNLDLTDQSADLSPAGPQIAQRFNRLPQLEVENQVSGFEGRQFQSAVTDSVLVSQVRPEESWQRYRWQLFDAAGVPLGTFNTHRSWAPFATFGEGTLVFLDEPYELRVDDQMQAFPRSLAIVNLASGELRWQVPVRDIQYRGPWPP